VGASHHVETVISSSTVNLAAFVEKYPPAPPAKPPENADQMRKLVSEDGVIDVVAAPLSKTTGRPGTTEGKHLWVIVPEHLLAVLETAPVRPPLQSGVVKHTNLTGGEPACCGGEVWADSVDPSKVYVNGGSGRYPPKDPKQLEAAVEVFADLGFRAVSAGWDEQNDVPARVFR